MRTPLITAALLLALPFAVSAEEMSGMDMKGMKLDGMDMESHQAAPTASAQGTIRAIDTQRNTITLAHGPVAALQWPPMTMAFKTTPVLLEGLKVGDPVDFEFRNASDGAALVSIRKR
ncbi:copper-binding protein [Pseudomonas sp. PDNC002]|uniref:copper-binding protein n=1 Tax=Pseudomonas sp. PDNC002 TaxID=2811422 RepID=UPI001965856E|nr:copper-binding protein [Pseudomonas sp. PDNC002]QRY77303.1 copper-binding protein [Pseudomonas sp. PDNC002]